MWKKVFLIGKGLPDMQNHNFDQVAQEVLTMKS